jgi:hypothetical protein
LGDDFKYGEENESFKSYINLPSQLRHNLSITNNMNQMKTKNIDTSTGHNYHNPLVKALSNSNLNMFNSMTNSNQLQLSKQNTNVHSVVDLLGLSNDEESQQHSAPRRPPPPVPTQKPAATTFKDIFGQDDMIATSSELSTPSQDLQEETLVQFSDIIPQPAPLIFVESSGSLNNNSNSNALFGFEDDFSTFNPTEADNINKISPSQIPPPLPSPPTSLPSLPVRPPPLAPQPKTSFSLFDDPFDPPAIQTTVPLQNKPPPLPPMPPNLSQKINTNSSSYMNDLESIDLAANNNGKKTISMPPPLPPMPPQRPQPPPLPPLPPAIKPNVVTNNNNNKINPFGDLDPFGDSFNPIPQQQQQQQQLRQPPLPPPRPNHFK